MSAEVVAILSREFPELGQETVERVLEENGALGRAAPGGTRFLAVAAALTVPGALAEACSRG